MRTAETRPKRYSRPTGKMSEVTKPTIAEARQPRRNRKMKKIILDININPNLQCETHILVLVQIHTYVTATDIYLKFRRL